MNVEIKYVYLWEFDIMDIIILNSLTRMENERETEREIKFGVWVDRKN